MRLQRRFRSVIIDERAGQKASTGCVTFSQRLRCLQSVAALENDADGFANGFQTREFRDVRVQTENFLVDIRDEDSFGMTLVSRLARIDHHFSLDFIFQ